MLVTDTPLPPWDDNAVEEPEKVWRWRYRGFREAGYDRVDAQRLAASEADLHQLTQLLEGGCPFGTAAEILR
jgi:hypothetical protein